MPRQKIPRRISDEVLTLSRRRCCLCFGLENDISLKKGQIAHLDHNPRNNKPENLAYFCLPHHDEYDSKPSQSKGLTIGEVKMYRDLLYSDLELTPTLSPSLEILSVEMRQFGEGYDGKEAHWLWAFWTEIYVSNGSWQRLSIPFHRCSIDLSIPLITSTIMAQNISIENAPEESVKPDIIKLLASSYKKSGQIIIDHPQIIGLMSMVKSPKWHRDSKQKIAAKLDLPVTENDFQPLGLQFRLKMALERVPDYWILDTGEI